MKLVGEVYLAEVLFGFRGLVRPANVGTKQVYDCHLAAGKLLMAGRALPFVVFSANGEQGRLCGHGFIMRLG